MKRSLGWRPTIAAGLLACVSPAAGETGKAERPRWQLPKVEVRADPLPDPLGPFPLATTRIGPEAVARRPGGTLADLLRPVGGVRVTSRGSSSGGAALSIRGATNEQILVLVDGRRRQSAQGGGFDFGTFPLEGVESVEVFRGGASALWGADALGGAVHVRTRRPSAGSVRVRLGAGSYGERNASAEAALGLGRRGATRIQASFLDTDGDFAYVDDRRLQEATIANGDVRRATFDVRADAAVAGGRVRLEGSALDAERGVPGSEEFPTPSARLEDERLSGGFRWSRPAPATWQPAFDVSWFTQTRRYSEPEAVFGPVEERHENVRLRGEISLDQVGDRFASRWAIGASRDRLDSTTDGRRHRDSFDARTRLTRDATVAGLDWRGMFAARADRVDGFDTFVSPRIGLLVPLWPDRLQVRGSLGWSYRTPSFDELFWPARATAAGNPDLAAERGRDVDLGIAVSSLPVDGELSAEVFRRTVDDLIQWIPGASGVWRPHNVGSAQLTGWELEARSSLSVPWERHVHLAGSVTRLSTEDRSGEPNVDGRELVYRPRWTATANARLDELLGGELEGTWRFVDDVFVTRANTKTLRGSSLFDLRYRRSAGPVLTFDLAVTNLSNETARDFRDYPLPGRAWKLGVTYRRSAS